MGWPGGSANAFSTGFKSTPPRRVGRNLSSYQQEPQGWRRLQLYRLFRRPDRSEVQPQRGISQYHREYVTPMWLCGAVAYGSASTTCPRKAREGRSSQSEQWKAG